MYSKQEFIAKLDGSLERKIQEAYLDGFENGFHERDAAGTCDPFSSYNLWRSLAVKFAKQNIGVL